MTLEQEKIIENTSENTNKKKNRKGCSISMKSVLSTFLTIGITVLAIAFLIFGTMYNTVETQSNSADSTINNNMTDAIDKTDRGVQ